MRLRKITLATNNLLILDTPLYHWSYTAITQGHRKRLRKYFSGLSTSSKIVLYSSNIRKLQSIVRKQNKKNQIRHLLKKETSNYALESYEVSKTGQKDTNQISLNQANQYRSKHSTKQNENHQILKLFDLFLKYIRTSQFNSVNINGKVRWGQCLELIQILRD